MTEEEALFTEWERVDTQQGSSSKGALFSFVPSSRALSHIGAILSGHQVGGEKVDFEDIEVVYFEDIVELKVTKGKVGTEPMIEESYPGEGILLKNLRSKVSSDVVNKLRYLFKIP